LKSKDQKKPAILNEIEDLSNITDPKVKERLETIRKANSVLDSEKDLWIDESPSKVKFKDKVEVKTEMNSIIEPSINKEEYSSDYQNIIFEGKIKPKKIKERLIQNKESNNESQSLSIEELKEQNKNSSIPNAKKMVDFKTINKDIIVTTVGRDYHSLDELYKFNSDIQKDYDSNLEDFIKSIGYVSKLDKPKMEEGSMIFF
jgi:hypothetical protein